MLYSCNKNNNVSALDYILDSNFGSVQGRGTPMKLGFGVKTPALHKSVLKVNLACG